jgi:ElaB/YqjD/DUF883 family membrane-anchored ribosome-binding protein
MFEEKDYEQLARDVRTLMQDVGQLRDDLRRASTESLARLGEVTRVRLGEARETAQEAGLKADRLAREHVWKTVAAAAAIGALLGSLFMRDRDRDK